MNTHNVACVVASGPQTNKDSSILLTEPVSEYWDEVREEDWVEHADGNKDSIMEEIASDFVESSYRLKTEATAKSEKSKR